MGKQKIEAVKQKKAASSVNSRTSTKKVSVGHTDLNRSFIQSVIPVLLDLIVASTSLQSLQTQGKSSNSILAMLKQLDESNLALIKRVSDLELKNVVTSNSISMDSQLQSDVPTLTAQNNCHSLTSKRQNGFQLNAPDIQSNVMQSQPS